MRGNHPNFNTKTLQTVCERASISCKLSHCLGQPPATWDRLVQIPVTLLPIQLPANAIQPGDTQFKFLAPLLGIWENCGKTNHSFTWVDKNFSFPSSCLKGKTNLPTDQFSQCLQQAWPGCSQKPGAPCRSPSTWQGVKHLSLHLLFPGK